jgi:protein-disulfide isomerase
MDVIISDINEGESRSIRGTPTFLVNGRPAEGSVGFGYLKQMIDEELASWQE